MSADEHDGEQAALHRRVSAFFNEVGLQQQLPESAQKKSSLLHLIRRPIRVDRVERGRITCVLTVQREICNVYSILHGGVVATVAEELARECLKTVAGNIELFVGEASSSYLSVAGMDEEVEIEARLVRQGRKVLVSSVDFRSKGTNKLLYTYRATFYHIPVASL